MERSVADIFQRWLTPQAAGGAGASCHCGGTCGGCGPTLGTGRDGEVARALRELGQDSPRTFDDYLCNMRDLYRVAEADLAIAAARTARHTGTLAREGESVEVRFATFDGEAAGALAIRYELAERDPKRVGEPHTWVLSAGMPEELAAVMTRLAPAWVTVKRAMGSGRARVVRAAQRKKPPRPWVKLLPWLQLPPTEGGWS